LRKLGGDQADADLIVAQGENDRMFEQLDATHSLTANQWRCSPLGLGSVAAGWSFGVRINLWS
jgi:hypothetical protein